MPYLLFHFNQLFALAGNEFVAVLARLVFMLFGEWL
jgi:hypothetical protein